MMKRTNPLLSVDKEEKITSSEYRKEGDWFYALNGVDDS